MECSTFFLGGSKKGKFEFLVALISINFELIMPGWRRGGSEGCLLNLGSRVQSSNQVSIRCSLLAKVVEQLA